MFTPKTKRGDLLFVETSGLRQNNLLSDNLGEIVDRSIYITFSTFREFPIIHLGDPPPPPIVGKRDFVVSLFLVSGTGISYYTPWGPPLPSPPQI